MKCKFSFFTLMINNIIRFCRYFAHKRYFMELSNEEKLLATGDISYLFRKFGIPAILGLLCIGLQPMVDGLFLGNFVGPDALAGVNLFMPLYTLITAATVIVGVGCQTIVSISLGQANYQRAHDAFRSASAFLLIFTSVMAAISFLEAETIGRMLGANEQLQSYIVTYIRHFAPFFPALALVFLGDYILKAVGRPFFALFLLGLVLLLNIVLDYVFIGIFNMGVAGAAMATGSAMTTAFILMFSQLARRTCIVNFRRGKISVRLVGRMLYNGSSEGLSELSAGITVLLFNWVMMRTFGADGVAAFTAVNYVLFLGVQLFVGLSDGIIPVLSYNYGAGNRLRMKQTLLLGFKTNAIIGLAFFLLIFFGAEYFMTLFFNNSSEEHIERILSLASVGASFVSFAFLLNGANIISSSFFTSMGDARTSVIISLLRGLIMIIIGITVYPMLFGDNGVWMVIPAAEALTFGYSLYVLKKKASWLTDNNVVSLS